MPKKVKAKATTKKRARSMRFKRRKTLKRVKRVKRAHKKLKWYRKFKGKNSIYKMNNSQGLKFSRWLSLADFIMLPYISFIHRVIGAAGKNSFSDDTIYIAGHSFTDTYIDQSSRLLGEILSVYSTADMTQNIGLQLKKIQTMMNWKAWNPFLCKETCGPLFMNMVTDYNQVKYVGVKVSWHPNIKYVNTRVVDGYKQDYSANNTTGFNYLQPITQGTTTLPLIIDNSTHAVYDVKSPDGILKPVGVDNDYYNYQYAGYSNPPQLRLWVNWNKQGYEQRDVLTEAMINSTGFNDGTTISGSRFCTAKVFKGTNQTFPGGVRSYPLSKRFKFYVRPYVVSNMQEAPSNNAPVRDYEKYASGIQEKIVNEMPKSDSMITSIKKMPFIQVNNLFPFYKSYDQNFTSNHSTKDVNIWNIVNTKGVGFVDPILFSWALSDDSIPSGAFSCPFVVDKLENAISSPSSNNTYLKYFINQYNFIQSLGRFKVTFYTKWRGRNQMAPVSSIGDIFVNANNNQEMPDMDIEDDPVKPEDGK